MPDHDGAVTIDDAGPLGRIVAELRAYEHWVDERVGAERGRADRAEAEVARLRNELLLAKAQADQAMATLAEQVGAATERERARLSRRQRLFADAVRSYAREAHEAQRALVELARRALDAPVGHDGDRTDDSTAQLSPAARPGTGAEHGWPPPGPTRWTSRHDLPVHSGRLHGDLGGRTLPDTDAETDAIGPPSDEHRLIDLHNQLDLARMEHRPTPWRRLGSSASRSGTAG